MAALVLTDSALTLRAICERGRMTEIDNICHSRQYMKRPTLLMQTMNISLPDPLKEFVEHQVADGRYSSVSEYIRELIRDDEKRKAQERLEGMLLEGLSDESTEMTRQDWDDIRKEAMAILKTRSGQSS
jgi:antitoxin ParD1/3/4